MEEMGNSILGVDDGVSRVAIQLGVRPGAKTIRKTQTRL